MNKGQIIFYSEKDLCCYNIENIKEETVCTEFSRGMYGEVYLGTSIPTFEYSLGREPIELDPTTMKKIARYNKEVEIERLDKIIEGKKAELEGLTKEYDFQLKKLENAKSFIKEFLGQSEYADPYDYVKGDFDDENDYDYGYDDEEE